MKQDNLTMKNLTIRIFSIITLSLFAIACNADSTASSYTKGKEYTEISKPIPSSSKEKVEVVELFWFGCGHCFALEPYVNQWLKNKPEAAEFKKVPAIFSERWEFHAKAFYTMQLLKVIEKTEAPFFNAIHVKKTPINNIDQLVVFLADYGVTREQVLDAFDSFAVDSNMRNARSVTIRSGAKGVPSVVVGGKYLTSVSHAGGQEELFKVVDFLVNKVKQEG